jgi:tetratricopeptide (TPR) repeat protein
LWQPGTNIDFDHSLANAIKRIRDVLGDSAESPRFIETLPRRGYRFLLPVSNSRQPPIAPSAPAVQPLRSDRLRLPLITGVAAFIVIASTLALVFWGRVHRTVNAEAYALYQRARYGPRLTRDSVGYFEKAIAKDPQFAPAHAGLSSTYITLALHAEVSPRAVMPQARQEALKALAIDPANAEAHLDLGTVKAAFDWDRVEAEREFRRALELDPTVEGGRAAHALFLAHMGRFDEALDQIAAFEKGPVGIQSVYASILYLSRQRQRTIEYCKWALGYAPNAEGLQFWLGRTYADELRLAEAIPFIEASRAANRQKSTGFGVLTSLYVRAGRRADAVNLLGELLELAKEQYISPASVAIAYIGLSDFDNAFAWLDRACFEHDFALSSLKVETVYDPIRSDPRFKALLRRVNLN